MTLTVGSLFSGIAGLDLGLERAGMEICWQVECDPHARRVLAKNFPGVHCYGDVRTITAFDFIAAGRTRPSWFVVPRVDVLCGGFPCQDISVAGKGAGIKEGTRSGLWLEFARLIRELRPRYVLVENVPALRSRGLDRVLGDLAASGYDAEWSSVSACSVGAPHPRDRLFVVAYPNSIDGEARVGDFIDEQSRALLAGNDDPRRALWLEAEPVNGGMADGLSDQVDRLRCLGNAVVPQVAEFIGRAIVAHAGARS